ncbi:MAG: right-handed parallel beta-helix repeat-containing protein [Chloroflexi bacterium]|nr:right-handed parallel beta-helix repeat-containing protein [Chloroflexota bacterium]
MKKAAKWFGIILAVIAALLLIAIVAAAAVPIATDPDVRANHGAGSKSVLPSYSGLQRAFPASNEPADNPSTPEKVALGQLLFFDPALSENNEMACATCHNPDWGFSDGRAQPLGLDGTPLARSAPTLWNVAYAQALFWDGRETSLEAQSHFPLTHANEMGVSNTAALVSELAAIPEYQQRFAAAFTDGLTYDNVGRALAAFQRSLLSQNSPFDRYAAGDFDALTAQQRRGLALFRSGATRCFECHNAPTFASDTFRVVGVPSDDPGRAGVVADGLNGAFKVPTLRNIALSAPYMHDGSLATLAEVVDFYAEGGGRAHGRDNIDVFVQGFTLNEQERADLVAFLMALTDESGLPQPVTAVPSGLPVIPASANPMRDVAASYNIGGGEPAIAERAPQTIQVAAGESIQTAVDRARPGDTVEIPYGVYHERVVIDISDFTLRGRPNEAGDYPILDGEGLLPEGVLASGNNFTVSHLHTRNYTDNGILVEGVTGVHFHDIFAENVGTYGVYPVQSTDVLIERVVVTGVDDAGIYAGQCENVIVRDSEAYGNVLGIELENTLNGQVYNNYVHDNTLGILIVLLPQLTSKISADTRVFDNVVENNNLENFAPGGFARIAPVGTGILLLATDNAEVTGNTLSGNDSVGVAVFGLERSGGFNMNEVDVGPRSENVWVHGNTFSANGRYPAAALAELGIPGADVIWDGQGSGNRFDEPGASTFPPVLPGSGWPAWAYRAYYTILNLAVTQMG